VGREFGDIFLELKLFVVELEIKTILRRNRLSDVLYCAPGCLD